MSSSTTPALSAASIESLRGELAALAQRVEHTQRRFDDLAKAVIPIGVALLEEKSFDRLVDTILVAAQQLCNADGGTLYLRTDDDQLRFAVVRNESLAIDGTAAGLPPLALYKSDGTPNHHNVATHAALTGTCVNIRDAYDADGFDFSGTRAFDGRTGYRSRSFLTVSLVNHRRRVIGVLQLINAKDPVSGEVIPFEPTMQPMVESLAALAAAAVEAFFREEQLRREIAELHIRIDATKKARQVAEVTDTDYFRALQTRARALRKDKATTDERR